MEGPGSLLRARRLVRATAAASRSVTVWAPTAQAVDARTSDPSGFCDRRVDALFARAASAQSLSPAAAPALWRRAGRAVLAQAPAIPVSVQNLRDVTFASRRAGDFEHHPEWGVLLDQLWVR
jgi:ABC-type transport system substrate-binding protein